MCNFAPRELERLWDLIEPHVVSTWNVGCGKKSASAPNEVLFMRLTALQHCGSWDSICSRFGMKSSPFQEMVKKFLSVFEPYLYEIFVSDAQNYCTMNQLRSLATFLKLPLRAICH
ncbi:hypothetical protein PHMEG_00033917 [Phytophthora megakarya]|uniref:Transposase n=1 Tax=Phytophthora megakarya TaxID=4795 RepID=A0A225USB9_9STRA|nr:hypothetical protein PHMEG_00033917 [Phytophthora megakarya]